MSVTVLYLVLHRNKPLLEATVQDQDGSRRRIEVKWLTRDPQPMPPEHWLDIVSGEVDLQRTKEHDEAAGRILFL